MTADVIRFPTPPERDPLHVSISVELLSGENVTISAKCSEPMHYFTDRTARCECGRQTWPEGQA